MAPNHGSVETKAERLGASSFARETLVSQPLLPQKTRSQGRFVLAPPLPLAFDDVSHFSCLLITGQGTFEMPTTKILSNPEGDPRVKAVFDDIRVTRGTDYINNLWSALAINPSLLESTWSEVKRLMASPTLIDPLTKDMVYIAVSVANACSYCVHSHSTAARARGMTDAQHAELLAIIALAGKTNHLVTGLQAPVDEVFDVNRKG